MGSHPSPAVGAYPPSSQTLLPQCSGPQLILTSVPLIILFLPRQLPFFHAHNLADNIVESRCWLRVLECARQVGHSYRCPNCHDIGGDLLEVNAMSYKEANHREATWDADTFGLYVVGDGAMIKKMPLINALVMNGNSRPVVAAIRDCADHMSKAGEKDAVYITDIFRALLPSLTSKTTRLTSSTLTGRQMYKRRGRSWR